MTLKTYADLEQGSDAWLEQRCGMVTASVVGKLLTPTGRVAENDTSRGLTATLIAERITGVVDPVFVSDDMLRGTEDEPRAVAVYEDHYFAVQTVGFMVEDRWGFRIGYSPDGLVGEDGLIEVKSRRSKTQLLTFLDDRVPDANMAQIQAGLLVTGREWCDYVSYCGGMPLFRKRVFPDKNWQTAIVEAVEKFESTASRWADAYEKAIEGRPMTERVIQQEMFI